MASVTFPVSLGGDGSTVTDDASPTTGLANGGHRARFVPALAQFVAVAGQGVYWGQTALTASQTALNAPGTQATTTAMLAISQGSKSFTLAQTGKNFVFGQYVALVSTSDPSLALSFVDNLYAVDDTTSTAPNWMMGQITAFNSGTGAMTVNVTHTGGAGTMASWTVIPVSPPELPSQAGHAGKVLMTNGSALSWAPISNDLMLQSMGIV